MGALGPCRRVGLLALLGWAGFAARAAEGDWPVYLGDAGSAHYSTLHQISARNVDRLSVAWVYHSGDARRDNLSQIQCNPLIIGGVLYGTTPGAVYRNLLFMPLRVGEGPAPAAPGHLRAYDIRTGRIVWTFHTIPWPGEPGYETWPPDAWTHVGGANCWAGMSVDTERGRVFVPTGSAAFDFWGGDRIGQDLFADCLIALDARTGRRVWHYQFVRHDLWDRDLPALPTLLTVRHGGRRVAAVAQVTKSGHLFVFDRETGEPKRRRCRANRRR